MKEILTVLWREAIFFRRRFFQITSSALVSPLLYLLAFGWGLGEDVVVEGQTYIHFIIPGIIALATMNTSFNAVSLRINISKLHEKSFEQYLTSPVRISMLTIGQIVAGSLRGIYSAILILLISYLFGVSLSINLTFLFICLLNSMLFAGFGYTAAMVINSHYEMNRFTSLVITPMTFLCGTFFSLERMPPFVKELIYLLPLTHTTRSLRRVALGGEVETLSILVLFFYLLLFYLLGVKSSYREVE